MTKCDDLIIGCGIIGLSIARELNHRFPQRRITIIDKEADTAAHASGRNSGVLHAGFYYTADSLKARFTVAGNQALRDYCRKHHLPVNACGKLVVAQSEAELVPLAELERRGRQNGSNVTIISAEEACCIEPNIRTCQRALWSPDTASVNPGDICQTLKNELQARGVTFAFNTAFRQRAGGRVITTQGSYEARRVINCAGLYADRIAHDYGFGQRYTIIPFKGLYLKYTRNTNDVRTNIYPVPNLKNPFLGVHFTKTVDGGIKIGPTAIPAFWREHYGGWQNLRAGELLQIGYYESKLFLTNAFGFRQLVFEEMRKYRRDYFVRLASRMVKHIDPKGFTEFTAPGIRAQLLDRQTSQLVQDFVVEGDARSLHVLNAVSPAFTCAFPFAQYVVNTHLQP